MLAHGALSETTFLLCKPDAEHAHRYILQVVGDAGFHVQAKSFRITAAVARDVAVLFPSVQKRHAQELQRQQQQQQQQPPQQQLHPGVGVLLSSTGKGVSGANEAGRHGANGGAAVPPTMTTTTPWRWDARERDATDVTAYRAQHVDEALPRSQALVSSIMQLTRHRRGSEAGVDAGLPGDVYTQQQQQQQQQQQHGKMGTGATTTTPPRTPSGTSRQVVHTHGAHAYSNDSNTATTTTTTTTTTNASVAAAAAAAPTAAAAAAVISTTAATNVTQVYTRLNSLSYSELLDEHVRHLAYGGTCLAVLLVAPGAVEALLRLVGPEDPLIARTVAPDSLRARLGTDMVRNAVYAAGNLAEVSACVMAVFGYTMPHYNSNSNNNYSSGSNVSNSNDATGLQMSTSMLPSYIVDGGGGAGGEDNGPMMAAMASLRHNASSSDSMTMGGNNGTGKHMGSHHVRTAITRALAQLPSPCSVSRTALTAAVRTAAAAVAESCAPESHLAYYIDGHPHRKQLLEQLGCTGGYADVDASDSSHLQPRALTTEALLQLCSPPAETAEARLKREQQALNAERAQLAQQAQQLRMREMDLLLREHALTAATIAAARTPAAASPPSRPRREAHA